MGQLFRKILDAGVSENYSHYLQSKIRITNGVALFIVLGAGIPFTTISILYCPSLTYVPVLGLSVAAFCIFLNFLGAIKISRLMIAMLPLLLATVYQIGLTPKGAPLAGSVFLFQLSFSLFVFLVYSLEEKPELFTIILINTLILVSNEYIAGWWDPEVDPLVFREDKLQKITTFLGILNTFGSILILVYQNRIAQQQSENLITEVRQNSEKMAKSEKEIKENLIQIQASQEKEKDRQWASEGLTSVSSILRDYENLQEMGNHFLVFLIRYLQANQGGLFIVHEENQEKVLRLEACYAYDRKKTIEKDIAVGQGLVGQAYLERDVIYLTDIPQHYVHITSGLGEATPTALIIIPFMINDEVEAILEIASFRPIKPHEIAFLKNLGEYVASTIRNNKVNARTKFLLEESKQQTEEMRAQEEEMRQNMEETQAIQEQSERLRTELEENQELLQEKLKELEIAQRNAQEVKQVEMKRAENIIKLKTSDLEKALSEAKTKEQNLIRLLQEKE